MTSYKPLRALALVCTLKPSPADSSSQLLGQQVLDALEKHGVESELVRVVDFNVSPGVQIDMGSGDQWPSLRQKILASDILVLATPTWMGHMSSIGHRVLERLDAELSESDDEGRLLTYGKVAVTAIVGNEDGAHHITAEAFQGLNDVGFTIPATGSVYWNAEVSKPQNFKDLPSTPDHIVSVTQKVASNAAHLARLLQSNQYLPV